MFENELENIGNMYMKMAIHTMHNDTITKQCVYVHMRNIYYTRIHLLYVDFHHTTCTNTCVYIYK